MLSKAPSLSPVVVAEHAELFVDAAEREFAQMTRSPIPAYFLVARAIELALKSSLLLRGHPVDWLKKEIGHDLDKGLKESTVSEGDERLNLSDEQLDAIRWINVYYARKDLEYPLTGAKRYPQPEALLESARDILRQLEPRLRQWRPSAS